MKRILILLLVFALFMGVMPHALAEDSKYEYLYYALNDDGTIMITGINKETVNVVIPEEIDGVAVTSIGGFSFSGEKVESVTIPDTVTYIGDYAFSSCYQLSKIIGGNNLVHVGRDAFYSTAYANDETNYKNGILYVGSAVIGYDKNKVPAKVEFLKGIKCIGGNVFNSCKSITEVVIPEGVVSIGVKAFYKCENLLKVSIPDSIEQVGGYVFENTAIYNNSVNWENGILYIGNSLIQANKNLSGAVKIKEGTKVIADEAFYQCRSITEMELPEGVQYVGRSAFWNCAFTVLKLPATLKKIDFYAFDDCSELESLYIADVESYLNIDMKNTPMYYATKLYIDGKRAKNIEIPNTITAIPDYAFSECDSIASVTIPASVKTIGECAFENCTTLKTVTIEGECLEKIGYSAFEDCSFESINIPKSVKEIGERAFAGCANLKGSITIPNGITSIKNRTFVGCEQLGKVILPDSVETIEEYAFSGCSELFEIDFPENLKTIGECAFYDCENLKNIWLPESVTSIGESAFSYCRFEKIVIPSGVKVIKEDTFSKCQNLKKVVLKPGVQSIDIGAFYDCSELEKIIIPKSVTEIETNAFKNAGEDVLGECGICTVEYEGSKEDFESIYIGASGNEFFETAKINYNSPLAGDIKNNAVTVTKTINEGVYLFDIKLSKTTENCFVYAAIYNGSDKIIAVRKAAIDESGNAKVYLNQKSGESYFKIFAWYGTQPIAKTVRQNF